MLFEMALLEIEAAIFSMDHSLMEPSALPLANFSPSSDQAKHCTYENVNYNSRTVYFTLERCPNNSFGFEREWKWSLKASKSNEVIRSVAPSGKVPIKNGTNHNRS